MKRFAWLLLFALAVRLPLMFGPLWYDENFSLLLARLPWESMLAATAGDVHPPLFYAVGWVMYHLVPALPAWAIRVPSLVFSLLSLVVMRQILIERMTSERMTWITLIIMAAAPMQIYYASEGRMYALLCLLTVLGFWAVQGRRWVWALVSVTLLAYTQNWGLFYGVALGLCALIMWPRSWKIITATFMLSAICWLPWARVLLGQAESINQTYWITNASLSQVALMLYMQLWSVMLGADVLSLTVTFAWLMLGIYVMRRDVVVLVMALVPVLIGFVISAVWQPVILARAVIGSAPFLYICFASVLYRAWPADRSDMRRALVASIVILPMGIMSINGMYLKSYKVDLRPNFIDTVEHIEKNWQPGDVIAVTSDSVVDILPYTRKPVIYIEQCKEPKGALTDATRRAIGYQLMQWTELQAARVWLVGWRTPLVDQCALDQLDAMTAGSTQVYYREASNMMHVGLWLIER